MGSARSASTGQHSVAGSEGPVPAAADAGRGLDSRAGAGRTAVVIALLALAAWGLRSGSLPSAGPPLISTLTRQTVTVIFGAGEGIVLAASLFLLVYGLLISRRRRRREDSAEDGWRVPWWVRAVIQLVVLSLFVLQVALLREYLRYRHGLLAQRHGLGPGQGGPGSAGHSVLASGTLASGSFIAGLVLVAVVLLLAGLLAWRRRRPAGQQPPSRPRRAALAGAATAGTAALAGSADPRAAIIACYAAMEGSLAEAGAPPHAADTPAEVLTRAAASGLIRSAAAGTLTGLFRHARYSEHAVTEHDRAEAFRALAGIRADLSEAGGAAPQEHRGPAGRRGGSR
jgi:hypothetical protein